MEKTRVCFFIEEVIIMDKKCVIDLSPKIFSIVSVISIMSIIIHLITDIVYLGRMDHKAIIPSIMLFVFSENNRVNSIARKNN